MSSAGLVPMLVLAESAALGRLADQHLNVPTDKGANPGLKVSSLVAGMVAGADSIDDMGVVRRIPAHLIRGTFRYASRKYWDELSKDLKPIYQAVNADA